MAIPHTDPCYVETTGIAIGVLKEPVSFFQMGTNPKENVKVPVKFVMMLAIAGKQHLEVLQRAILLIQDAEVLKMLVNAGNPEEIIQIIKNKEEFIMRTYEFYQHAGRESQHQRWHLRRANGCWQRGEYPQWRSQNAKHLKSSGEQRFLIRM